MGSGCKVPRCLVWTDRQTDRHQTYRTGVASGAARNQSSEHFVIVIILFIYLFESHHLGNFTLSPHSACMGDPKSCFIQPHNGEWKLGTLEVQFILSGLLLFGRSFLLHAESRSDVIVVISGWLFSGTK